LRNNTKEEFYLSGYVHLLIILYAGRQILHIGLRGEAGYMIPFILAFAVFIRTLFQMLREQEFRHLFTLVGIVLAIGTIVYHNVEGWGWLDSLYFPVITLTTIGYGDFSPSTDIGKVFTIMYVFMGLGVLVGFVTATGEYLQKRQKGRLTGDAALAFWPRFQESRGAKEESFKEQEQKPILGDE
jgi:hypothetical protein